MDSIDHGPDGNQSPPLQEIDLFSSDAVLVEGLRREGGAWAEARLAAFGQRVGGAEVLEWAVTANEQPPSLRSHDRTGQRIDEVELHPAWHSLLGLGVEHGLHALPWREPRPGANPARAGLFFLLAQVEAGVGCPLSMTFASVAALRQEPRLAAIWEPGILSLDYDPRSLPATAKRGLLCGMSMTERQGGSDVRANTTTARPLGGPAGRGGLEYEIQGQKWFCSAPRCDAFLILAQAPGGLTCFLLPRVLPDGGRNPMHLVRLKDKLGNRSNASAEIELAGALAYRIGEEGRGVPAILEMVNRTRLDCVIGSAAALRIGTARALHHALHRRTFGRRLADHPLMRNVLADLALESEAATTAMIRLARTYDGEDEAPLRRVATAVLKYWVCKRAASHAAEALECLGGNGYVEEWGMARLYREAPLNSIWEGSGNIQCLEVLRALQKSPESFAALRAELDAGRGGDVRLDRFTAALLEEIARGTGAGARDVAETSARRWVEGIALAFQGSLLIRFAPPAVADAFCASRLADGRHGAFGTLPPAIDFEAILTRAAPSGMA